MSNIDDVIQRARQPGGFSEQQQQFTVARERAIHKMREFALADPHFYILELIQSTVANGGEHVHIEVDDDSLQFSYVGGGYAREELAQLFDFLFASKESLAHSDIRQLAVGTNALMIMEPDRVVIESGDGTLESTDRIEIRGDQNTVEVGTPNQSLRGTYIRADGLDRSQTVGKSGLEARTYGPPECTAIEQRCLAAPVPIIVNNEPVFGYTSQRTPVVFGYDDVVTFDEGDLYGSIGVPEHSHKESFKLMTFGVWLESSDAALMGETRIGGVVCYDRLNKTADHSGVVRDERFEELWARIRPYARQSAEGRAGRGNYRIKHLSGTEIPSGNLREFFRSDDTFVVVPEETQPDGERGKLAGRIGDALEAPVLRVDRDAFDSVSVLAGSDSALLEPNLEAPSDLEFYRRGEASEPDRPWLTGAVDLESIEVEALGDALVADASVSKNQRDILVDHFDDRQSVEGTVYTPETTEGARELHVRVLTLDRVLWEGSVRSPLPGHVLDVELPAIAPSHLLGPPSMLGADEASGAPEATDERRTVAEWIATVVAARAVDELREATRRALENLTMHQEGLPGDTGRRIALGALSRSTLKRIRTPDDDDRVDVHFSLVRSQPGPDLLNIDIFEALDGTTYGLRDLEELMDETYGLVYGVVPEVEPALEGLDRSRILDLDLERERHLLTILGEAAYVRVDRRDVIAESGPFQVRDLALGLKEYPDFPLLVEGGDPTALDDRRREKVVADLVEKLAVVYADEDEEPSIRREAVRHLQWFVCRRTIEASDAPTYQVETLPLFLDGRGRGVTFEQVRDALRTDSGVEMVDGRSSDICELGSLTEGAAGEDSSVHQLTMNTWVYPLLAPHGRLRGAFEFDFTEDEAAEVEETPSEAFLADRRLDRKGFEGRVGIPYQDVDRPAVAIFGSDRSRAYRLRGPAAELGLTGFLQTDAEDPRTNWNAMRAAVSTAGREMVEELLDRLPELEDGEDEFDRLVEALFDYAARRLKLTRRPNGTVVPHLEGTLAQKILELPLFPTRTGNPVTGMRVVREFCANASEGPMEVDIELSDELPASLDSWLDHHLSASNIVAPADDAVPSGPEASSVDLEFEFRVREWLDRLRPDDYAPASDVSSPRDAESRRATGSSSPSDQKKVDINSGAPGTSTGTTRAPSSGPGDSATESGGITVETISTKRAQNLTAGVEFDADSPCRYVNRDRPTLYLNEEHPLVRRASNPDDPWSFAWLLLASYAEINDVLEPVTNKHELEFQRRVSDSIGDF